jgi:hypothetical protein
MNLKPDALGSLELIDHALEHVQRWTDSDRRFALISFDNAIETAMNWFLHSPAGRSLVSPDELKRLERNRRARTSFVCKALSAANGATIDAEDIGHIERRRNQLYHDGAGICPDKLTLLIAQRLAYAVHESIFGSSVDEGLVMRNAELAYLRPFENVLPLEQARFLNEVTNFLTEFAYLVDRPPEDYSWLESEATIREEWHVLSEYNEGRLRTVTKDFDLLLSGRTRILNESLKAINYTEALLMSRLCGTLKAALTAHISRVRIIRRLKAAIQIEVPESWTNICFAFGERTQEYNDGRKMVLRGPIVTVELADGGAFNFYGLEDWGSEEYVEESDDVFSEDVSMLENVRRLFTTADSQYSSTNNLTGLFQHLLALEQEIDREDDANFERLLEELIPLLCPEAIAVWRALEVELGHEMALGSYLAPIVVADAGPADVTWLERVARELERLLLSVEDNQNLGPCLGSASESIQQIEKNLRQNPPDP